MPELIYGCVVVFLVGLWIAGQVNHAIYRLAWNARWISPWTAVPPTIAARRPMEYLPVVGWWRLRREAIHHGPWFWVRPLLLELGLASFLAWLCWFELSGQLVPVEHRLLPPQSIAYHWPMFVGHLILIPLLTAATFIDLDEQTIPDEITVPGTWVGLILCTLAPRALLPHPDAPGGGLAPLWVSSPNPWPSWLDGSWGLGLGWACFTGWFYALLPKTWWTRSGWRRAMDFLVASIRRHPNTRSLTRMWLVGMVGISAGWAWGGFHWQGLFTALVGLAFGGGLVWAVRVLASSALRCEAMGFGDVTLMAMIGAMVGWQAALLIFFLAPFAGAVLAVIQWMLTGRRDIAYGPFLAAATVLVIVAWAPLWHVAQQYFHAGWMIPAVVGLCVVLMGLMLYGWRAYQEGM